MSDELRKEEDKLPIKMDMPGKTHTFGINSHFLVHKDNFQQKTRLNVFKNSSTAEMTMYYRSGRAMFTYTWPEVETFSGNVSIENQYTFDENNKISLTGSAGLQQNYIKSDVGYNLNQVFHQFDRKKERFLLNLYASYEKKTSYFTFLIGFGYGQRPPSVSEAYGFYLFNSADGFDYIGNPNLENETSFEGNFLASFKKNTLEISAKLSAFHIKNYIFGRPFGEISWQMTPLGINKRGVKMYEALKYAQQMNISIDVEYSFLENYYWNNLVGYAYGKDFEGNNLPFIRPIHYSSAIGYRKGNFSGEFSLTGDFKQTNFSKAYGEDATPAYTLVNISIAYQLPIYSDKLELQFGIENALNTYYSTYSDWKNFPRMGRNFLISATFRF